MYWVRTTPAAGFVALSIQLLLIALSGWILAKHAFKLPSRERIPIGLGLGLILYVFFSNLLGQWISPEWAFWVALFTLGLIAGLAWFVSKESLFEPADARVWPQLIIFASFAILITLIGRGLGIFDDRKNLSIISLMAAGDIPPHFYMNSDFLFSYHYGFQLLGASLVRIGSLFPWSAFDLSKGIVAALAIWLSYIWGRRASRSQAAGIIFALFLVLVSGTRWLLLLLPPSLVASLSDGISLWGSGAQTAQNLPQALTSSWVIEGGPPLPIPFAFTNGIVQPFILYMQAGPRSLSLLIFFTLMLTVRRRRSPGSFLIVTLLLATWALTAEAEFALFMLGIGLVALACFRPKARIRTGELRSLVGMGFIAGFLSLIQGGTLTQITQAFLSPNREGIALGSLGPDTGFGLRIPPAIVSSHLGELNVLNPGQILISVLELGPLLLLAPLALRAARRAISRRNFPLAAVGISTFLGFILPIFIRYNVDRDVSRLTQYALIGWLIMSWPALAATWRRGGEKLRVALAGLGFISVFGGLVVAGPLLSAIQTAVLTDEIAPVDAAMLRSTWDRLEPGSLILDSDPWRAVAISGRLTRSSASSYETLAEWEILRAQPVLDKVVGSGFDYIYIDSYWWDSMGAAARDSYENPCVQLVHEAHDNAQNSSRWLYDLRACKAH
jgi:hypothetical protein